MAAVSKIRLRGVWFSIHKWIGILLAILIIPVSLSGSALVWHDWLDATLNPERSLRTGPQRLTLDEYAAASRRHLAPEDRVVSVRNAGPEDAVVVTATRPAAGGGRPLRTTLWLDPPDGRLLDSTAGNEGMVRTLHVLHGSLMVPRLGRQIVGWIGVFMLVTSLAGLWLWWPSLGGLRRGMRWRRQETTNANLHHMAGFWIALPLAMLSFTGVWISFPGLFGGAAPAPAARAAPPMPLAQPRMEAQTAASRAAEKIDGQVTAIAWPTDRSPLWTISVRSGDGLREAKVDDRTGAVTTPAPRPETTSRLMRRWHDGDGMGPVWQIVIFIGGIVPALLAVTGIIMWLRTRRWRRA